MATSKRDADASAATGLLAYSSCESDDRNECKCPQFCSGCGTIVSPLEPDYEWPGGRIYCWECAHTRIDALEAELSRLLDVVCEQDVTIIESVLEG